MAWRRPRLVPLLAVLMAIAVLCALGTWQVQRLMWKEALIATAQTHTSLPPLSSLSAGTIHDVRFRTVSLTGRLLPTAVHLTPRYHRGKMGSHTLVPLQLQGGRHVLLNFGWRPTPGKETEAPLKDAPYFDEAALHRKYGDVDYRVYGRVRLPQQAGWFTPENRPESGLWFWADTDAMAHTLGVPLLPWIVEVEQICVDDCTRETATASQPPCPCSHDDTLVFSHSWPPLQFRNDHLQYAIIWFTLALAAALMFAWAHWQRPHKKTQGS